MISFIYSFINCFKLKNLWTIYKNYTNKKINYYFINIMKIKMNLLNIILGYKYIVIKIYNKFVKKHIIMN